MININHQELLKDFGKSLGIELCFDKNGNCDVIFNDNVPVTIKSNEDDGLIVLSTPLLDELPEPVSYSTVLTMLSMALQPCMTEGGNTPVLGLDEDTGLVILYQVCTATDLQAKGLLEIFTEFITSYISIKDDLSKQQDISEDDALLSENGMIA